MIPGISEYIRETLHSFKEDDALLLDSTLIPLDDAHFAPLHFSSEKKKIAFVDGGQAEILSAGNFSLHFIRVAGQIFEGIVKKEKVTHEFYLFTYPVSQGEVLYYKSVIFTDKEKLIDEQDLFISSYDQSIRVGVERGSIIRIASMARRFAELSLASSLKADFVMLDGTLEKTFVHEEKYLSRLPMNACALAKSNSLLTLSGNSPIVLLNKRSLYDCFVYVVDDKTSFVKLHPDATHVFRFEGQRECLLFLQNHVADPLFLGYPYGLVYADQIARVSNQEREALMMRFLLDKKNEEILPYLRTMDVHGILDSMS